MNKEWDDLSMAAENREISRFLGTKIAVEFTWLAEAQRSEATDPKERWKRLQELLLFLAQLRWADIRTAQLAMK